MKKILLMMVAFVATMSAFAQEEVDGGWEKQFTPVEEADDFNAVRVAQAGDGSVYVASSYNQVLTFAGKALPDTEGMISSAIVKYNADGEEQWAVSMVGNVTVTAMAADEDGTLYATGVFLDEVDYTGTDNVKASINSADVMSAFVAKVSKDGKFEGMKVITPEVDAEIAAAEGFDPWGEVEGMVPLYTMWDPIYVNPTKLQIDGDKVYVAANYMGDVKALGWEGAYIDLWGMSYSDDLSKGVFSLNKSDLSGEKSVAVVQKTGIVNDTQTYPEALDFVADNGTVYVGFFGFGNLSITASGDQKDYTFDEGKHPFVLATVTASGISNSKVYDAPAHGKIAKPYKVMMGLAGDNVIIGGTFYGALPFDNTLTSGEVGKDGDGDVTYSFASAAFVTSVKKDGAVNWANATAVECKGVVMVVTGDEIHAATDKGTVIFETATGELEADEYDDEDPIIADASAWEDEYATLVLTDDNTVYVLSKNMNEDELEEGLIEIAQSQGKEYDNFKRAELVEGEKYNTYTVTEDLQIAIKMMNVDVKDCDYVVVKFAEPVAAGWRLAFWSNQDLTEVPEGAKEYKYVFADDPKCGVTDGVLPQICMMTFFGGFTAPLEAKVVGIYKHMIAADDIDAPVTETVDDDYPVSNLLGQPIDDSYKGIAVTKSGKKVYIQ